MTFIFFLQLVLPLFLIAWIALAPLSRKLGFCCQVIGTATGLFALALNWVVACPAVVVAVSVCDFVGGDGNYLAHPFRRAGKTGFLRRCLLLSVAAAWRGQRAY